MKGQPSPRTMQRSRRRPMRCCLSLKTRSRRRFTLAVHAEATCTVVSCSFTLSSVTHEYTEEFMKSSIGVFILTLVFAFSVGCSSKPSQMQNGNSAQTSDNSAPQGSGNTAAPEASQPPAPVTITVPAGKVLTVRLPEEVGSKLSQSGQSFRGTFVRPVDVNGGGAIPAGARVERDV